MRDRLGRKEWEEFQTTGRIPGDPQTPIAASWRRSLHALPGQVSQAPRLPPDELHAVRERSRRFMAAAIPGVREAARQLDRSGNMVLLCDPHGIVIGQFGDPATMDRGHENNLFLGGRWSERDIGTNAIGIALQSGRASRVIGAEHYAEAIHRWSCAATPVHDPETGTLLGVINISWPAELQRSAVEALSALLGYQAELSLHQQQAHERSKLIEVAHERRILRGNAPVMMLDRQGKMVFGREESSGALPAAMLREHLVPLMPDLLQAGPEGMAESLRELGDRFDFEVIREADDGIGLLIHGRERARGRPTMAEDLDEIAAIGQVMHDVCDRARKLARGMVPLLIEGEPGVGKTTLTRAIHQIGPDAARPFEVIECAMLTAENLREHLDSGGGVVARLLFGGTLCLDRPAAATPEVQGLLPVLLDRLEAADVRLITLCGEALYDAVNAGRFRSDLYFRLAGARLIIPPLRERRDEIMPSLRLIERRSWSHRRRLDFTAAAEERLRGYHWPGNLREMENLVRTLHLLDRPGRIDRDALPREFDQPMRSDGLSLREAEHDRILEAIRRSKGNMTEAARRLGIARSTLYLKMDSFGISRPGRG